MRVRFSTRRNLQRPPRLGPLLTFVADLAGVPEESGALADAVGAEHGAASPPKQGRQPRGTETHNSPIARPRAQALQRTAESPTACNRAPGRGNGQGGRRAPPELPPTNPHLPGISPARPLRYRTSLRPKPLTPNCGRQPHDCWDSVDRKSKGSQCLGPIPTSHGPDPRPIPSEQNPCKWAKNESGRPDLNRGPHRPELWARSAGAVRSTCKSMGSGLGSPPPRSSDIAVDSRGFARGMDSLPNDDDDAGSLVISLPAPRPRRGRRSTCRTGV